MSAPLSNLLVAVAEQAGFIKITGRANFAASVNFKTLVNELRSRGFKSFVLDLRECSTMDSTFLGVLVGLVIELNNGTPDGGQGCLELLNPTQRIADLLENLGVAHLFRIVQGQNPVESALEPTAPGQASPSREEVSKTCLEAHRVLMAVNPENIPKFKDVAQFLAEDLKKQQP